MQLHGASIPFIKRKQHHPNGEITPGTGRRTCQDCSLATGSATRPGRQTSCLAAVVFAEVEFGTSWPHGTSFFGVFGGVWLQARVVFSLPIQRVFLLSHFASPTFQAMSWLLATAALVGAVPAPNFGAVWQPHAPEADELVVAIDLDLCSNKATFTNSRCPSVTGQRWDDEHVSMLLNANMFGYQISF